MNHKDLLEKALLGKKTNGIPTKSKSMTPLSKSQHTSPEDLKKFPFLVRESQID